MIKKLLVFAATAVVLGAALPAEAHSVFRYDSYTGARYKVRHAHTKRVVHRPYYAPRYSYSRSYWSPGQESHERAVTRDLNRNMAAQAAQAPRYYYPQYSYRY